MRWLGLLTLLFAGAAGLLWGADVRKANDEPVKGFLVHEWGVWRVHDDAEFANADLRAQWDELPAFVYGQTTTRDLPHHWEPAPMAVTKPVLFFHAPQALAVTVRVEFTTGIPAVWWPATESPASRDERFNPRVPQQPAKRAKALDWKLHLKQPLQRLQQPPAFQPLSQAHWMRTLRDVKCDEVFASVGQRNFGMEREKFVYYDGLLPPVKALSLKVEKGKAALTNQEKFTVFDLWIVDNRDAAKPRLGRLPRLEAGGMKEVELAAAQGERWAEDAGKILTAQLKDAGLHEDEAASLTTIWTTDFFRSAGVTLFYRVPPEEYERLLPLTVRPRPEQIVRVGLIQQLTADPEMAARVARLVKQLDDDEFNKREAAQQELTKLGRAIFGYLRRLQPTVTAPEPKRRLEQLLEKIDAQRALNP